MITTTTPSPNRTCTLKDAIRTSGQPDTTLKRTPKDDPPEGGVF